MTVSHDGAAAAGGGWRELTAYRASLDQSSRLVRPGLMVIEQSLAGAAREAARQETGRRVALLPFAERRRQHRREHHLRSCV